MVRVTVETMTGATTMRASVTAASVERALKLAGGEERKACVVPPITATISAAGSPAKAA